MPVVEPTPDSVRVECPNCGAQAVAAPDAIGRRASCPTCRQRVVVTRAKPPTGDERTLVVCRLCQTRMFVASRHIGKKVKCPDCGVLTVVTAAKLPRMGDLPEALRAKPTTVERPASHAGAVAQQAEVAPLVSEQEAGLEYRLDDRPVDDDVPEATREILKRAEADVTAEAASVEKRRKKTPRAPLLFGVWGYLRSDRIAWRHLMFSTGLALIGLLAADGLYAVSIFNQGLGVLADASSILGVAMIILSVAFGYLWLGAFASLFYATITESSVGNDRVYHRIPVDPLSWLGDGLHLAMAASVSVAPGAIVAAAAGLDPAGAALAVAVSVIVCAPVVVLSQLEIGSAFGLFSPRLLAGLFRAPFSWALLLFESSAMAAIIAGCALVIARHGWPGVLLTAPVAVFLLLLYARLLGRLAWQVARD